MEPDRNSWNEKVNIYKENLTEGFNSRLGAAEENIHELEYMGIKFIQTEAEEDKEKGWKKNEQNFSDLWNNIKWFTM